MYWSNTYVVLFFKILQKSQDNAKSAILDYRGPGGLFILAELLTDNLSRTRTILQGVVKKFK